MAAGNCVVAKPSEITPKTAYYLGQICKTAKLPDGVLNIIHGYGHKAGDAIVTHEDVKAISFTGGTSTGKVIATKAAPKFKKLSLELGGKNPNIIFADADFQQALNTSLRSSFSNQGQICLCGSRIFVERPIYEQFKTEFIAKTHQLKVGDPEDGDTDIGAVVNRSHMEKILRYVELAKEEGGEILIGGKRVELKGRCEQGYFVAPTIIEGLAYDSRVNQEEIFGPVVTITPFDYFEDVIKWANSTEYGLAASVWTKDLDKAHRLAEKLDSGMVWINCWMLRDLRTPFGGVQEFGCGKRRGLGCASLFH